LSVIVDALQILNPGGKFRQMSRTFVRNTIHRKSVHNYVYLLIMFLIVAKITVYDYSYKMI